jgi:uncharacterized protein (TIGR02246 family)
MLRLLTILILGATAALAAQTAAPAASDARRAIDAGNAQYRAAFLAGDADALARVYDTEGSRLNEGGAVLRGRAAIAADVGAFIQKVGPVRVEIGTVEVWLVDDTAYETGTWSYTFQPKGQKEQRIGGRYVTLWKRQAGGGWKIWADIGVPGT